MSSDKWVITFDVLSAFQELSIVCLNSKLETLLKETKESPLIIGQNLYIDLESDSFLEVHEILKNPISFVEFFEIMVEKSETEALFKQSMLEIFELAGFFSIIVPKENVKSRIGILSQSILQYLNPKFFFSNLEYKVIKWI